MKYSEVRNTLQENGKEIGHYHQESQLSNTSLKNAVSNGFCAGASLAWVRRVLHGGSAKEGPEDLHAVVAQLSQKPGKREEFYGDRKAALQGAFQKVQRQTNTDISALNVRAQQILSDRLPRLSPQQQNDLIDKVQASLDKETRAIRARDQAKQDQINLALKTDALYDQFWKEFAKQMDAKLKTTDYSSLTVVRCSRDRQYGPENGLKTLLGEVLTDRSLAAGNAAMIGLSPPTTGTAGHTVAVHRINQQLYYFFDPNFGTFAVDARKLIWMFLYLFLKAYPQLEEKSSDNHDYEINGIIMAEYVIYKGPSKGQLSAPLSQCDLG